MPPHVARAHDEIVAVRGEPGRLLVVAEVEEAGRLEHLGHVPYDVLHHLVVLGQCEHAVVVLEPHAAQAHDFVAELVRRPAALDRELRMARVHEAFADVDDQHVESALRHAVDHAPPQLVLVAERVVRTVSLMYRGSGLHIVGQPFAPHVVAEVEQ